MNRASTEPGVGQVDLAMRIVHIIDSLGAGGAERSLVDLAIALPDHDIEPIIITLHERENGFADLARQSGVVVEEIGGRHMALRLPALRARLRELRPDVVHTSLVQADLLGRLATFRTVPVVASLVNTTYGPYRRLDPQVSLPKLRAVQAFDILTARTLTTHFHSITEAVRDAAIRDLRLPPERITVVPRGRDRSQMGEPSPERRACVREQLGIGPNVPVLLNVGRQEHQKGQAVLLEAAKILAEGQPEAVWLVAGRAGNATSALRTKRSMLGLDDQVQFLGHRTDVPDLLAAADVFVFPSHYEGLGGAVLEAMALEVPIVASDVPALREVLRQGAAGILLPAADPAAFATAVQDLLASPMQRRRIVDGARREFEQRYTLEQTVPAMVRLFESVAASKVRGWS